MIDAADLPPGPGPSAWNLLAWMLRPAPFMERSRARYGDRFSARMGPEGWWVFLSDPDEIRQVFTAPADIAYPGEGSRILEPILGSHSILVLDGQEHLTQRRLMLPAFHGERMQRLTGTVEDVAREAIGRWPRGETVPLHGPLQAVTLEIILRAVFGLDSGPRLDALRGLLTQLLDRTAQPLTLLPAFRKGKRWERMMALKAEADGHMLALVDERRASGEERDDVLSMLLAARTPEGEPMTDAELRDELVTLLVAGHETTASALSWTFEQLLRDPETLERTVAAADADDTAWLDAVGTEALRRRPVLPIAMPRRLKAPYEVGGIEYPEGIAFACCIYLVHHDPRIYPEPYAFRPQRFIDQAPGTYTWLPFGGGMRRCLGARFAQLEMRIVLRELLRACEVRAGAEGSEGTRRRAITLSPRRGTPVVLAARTTAPRPAEAVAV